MAKKFVYSFSEGNAEMREILGNKGANLCEMSKLKLPVPEGFIVSTEACGDFYQNHRTLSEEILKQINFALSKLEVQCGKKLGGSNPLFVSVRSGGRASMPGMMDTILNLGINDQTVTALAKRAGSDLFAYDCYYRFIMMYGEIVAGINRSNFEKIVKETQIKKGIKSSAEFTVADFQMLILKFKQVYKSIAKEDFPGDVNVQLAEAVKAVFKSWQNPRAVAFRRMNAIPSDWGTAVTVERMVFGNMGKISGTGVAFSRNPITGENVLYGEYLMNTQGEDLVSGAKTPSAISELKEQNKIIYEQFAGYARLLEQHYKDVQEMEFTIENGKLFMLQTRNAKRTIFASLKVAVDMVNEKLINKEQAILMIDPNQFEVLLHTSFDEEELKSAEVIARGLAASPGAASGKAVFSVAKAKEYKKKKIDTILVRAETSPKDVEAMQICRGILTVRGGTTSHAAVIARGLGTPCVVGCGDITIDEDKGTLTAEFKQPPAEPVGEEEQQEAIVKTKILNEGDDISIDGSTGQVFAGSIKTKSAAVSGNLKTIMNWVDYVRVLKVRANADTPADAEIAYNFGAEGIGLVRTEHMFFDKNRILAVREMIIRDTFSERQRALLKLQPMQKQDFVELFTAMKGQPVTIRLLDLPLHEFLPKTDDEMQELAKTTGLDFEEVKTKVEALKEVNPMMGHRGCRLAITYPEIVVMQTTAIISAALEVNKNGLKVVPEIMLPLIVDTKELEYIKDIIIKTADDIIERSKRELKYLVGCMIETPRAALISGKLAAECDFFSYGTNDLTQMTYAFSRDDVGTFINDYYNKMILGFDPFTHIDEEGVGELVKMSVNKGRQTNKNIKLGICGEQGGDPDTIEFCDKIGLNYVSCSAFRVPVARLAAAQAAIRNKIVKGAGCDVSYAPAKKSGIVSRMVKHKK